MTWLSETDAAIIVQKHFRASRANDFKIKDFSQIVVALRFQRQAEDNFTKYPQVAVAQIVVCVCGWR